MSVPHAPAPASPVHSALLVARAAGEVKPVGQAAQAGLTVRLPLPGLHVPATHSWQVAPPKPGSHAVTV